MNNLWSKLLSIWKGLNKNVVIAVATTSAVVVTGGVATGVYLNSPEVVAINSMVGFAEDLLARDEFSAVAGMIDGGSVEASMSKFEVDGEDLFEDVSLSGKLYLSKDTYMVENLNIKTPDQNISADIYTSYDLFYIKEDNIIGGAYGVTPNDLEEDFKNSIFAYGSGSDYEIGDKDVYDALLKYMESIDKTKKMNKDMRKLAKDVYKDLYKIVFKHAEFESENDKKKIGGEKINVRIVTIKIDEKAVVAILEDVYDYLDNNKKIADFLDEYDDCLSGAANIIAGHDFDSDTSIEELYDEFLEEFEENLDETCDEIEKSDVNFKVEIITPRNSDKLLKLTLKNDGEETFSIDVGANGIKKSDCIIIESYGETVSEYKIKENSNKKYSASLEVGEEKIFSIEVDRKDGTFEAELTPDKYTELCISGTLSSKGAFSKTTTIGVEEISYTEYTYDWYGEKSVDGEGTVELNLTVTLKDNDRIPSPDKNYKTIRDLEDDDVDEWVEKITELLENFDL